jgi:hypothetical protein
MPCILHHCTHFIILSSRHLHSWKLTPTPCFLSPIFISLILLLNLMEYRGSSGVFLCWTAGPFLNMLTLQHCPFPSCFTLFSTYSIAIAPSPTPALRKPASIAFSSSSPAPILLSHVMYLYFTLISSFSLYSFALSLFLCSYNVQSSCI